MPSPDAFHAHIAEALAFDSPAPLLEVASALASTDTDGMPALIGADPRATPIAQLAAAFLEADEAETNAIARVWAAILGDDTLDDMLRRRLITSVSKRDHPAWLNDLKQARVTRASSFGDVYNEQETLMLEVQIGEHAFVLACALTHFGGVMLEDAYLIASSIAEAAALMPAEITDGTIVHEVDLATAAATVRGALRLTNMSYPPLETETWPATKPALEWLLRQLPAGEAELAEPLAPEVIDHITADFARSPEGRSLSTDALDDASLLFSFGATYGAGDPLRWGPMFTELILFDLIPRKFIAPDQVLLRIPRVLRAVVTWAHAQSGISAANTKVVIDLIKKATPEYRRLVQQGSSGTPSSAFGGAIGGAVGTAVGTAVGGTHQGAARGAARGAADYDFDYAADAPVITQQDYESYVVQQLATYAGGLEALRNLDDTPLPAESYDEVAAGVSFAPDAIVKVQEIAALIQTTGARYFNDPELVTVALRLLVRTALADPAIYRRRSKSESAACSLCWIAAQNNEWFDGHRDKSRSVKALTAAFGVKSPPQDRAATMLHSLGVSTLSASEVVIGDAALLTAAMRAGLIVDRDAIGV